MSLLEESKVLDYLERKNPKSTPSVANKWVTHTVVYPIEVEMPGGGTDIELRAFVRMGEFCSPRQWEIAKSLEERYKTINQKYTANLKQKGAEVFMSEPGNPLKITPMTQQQ